MQQTTDQIIISTEIQQVITSEQAWHYHIIPKSIKEQQAQFYIDQEVNTDGLEDELEILINKKIILHSWPTDAINQALGRYYRKSNKLNTAKDANIKVASNDFIEKIIMEADELGSSDIHFEIYEEICRVRIRIDGKLIEKYILQKNEYPALINKLKIKSELDISEKRLPQDGRIIFNKGNSKFDIRVSVLPSLHGEKVVLRLLSKDATNIDISLLGFREEQKNQYLEGTKKPFGIILISGPTGSGKTTTLYATLKILNKEESNILTIEDPIEYTLDGINQVQLRENIGLTFARALRTFLRQDPDIIMLGEIRDGETAQMAIRAALTGHLVLSTIHTNSAWGTISRLIDMGVPSFLVADTLNLSVAQRLVRILCPHCKKEVELDTKLLPGRFRNDKRISSHFVSVGCDECFYTGYQGRKAVYEVVPMDEELQEAIKQKKTGISTLFKNKNIKTLSEGAFELYSNGLTSLDEIYSILLTNETN